VLSLKNSHPDAKIVSFSWSGKNSHQARIDAGRNLANLIESYSEADIFLIAHSHGGNVCFLASQELTERKSKSKIHTLICLGTPISAEFYAPAMESIKKLINLFSLNDFVQPVFGMFDRLLKTERTVNAAITINGKEPDHYQMHDPLIARWLDQILNCASLDVTFWNGMIHFYQTTPPIALKESTLEQQVAENQKLIYDYLSAVEQQLLFRSSVHTHENEQSSAYNSTF